MLSYILFIVMLLFGLAFTAVVSNFLDTKVAE
jgi:hypothetical protein